VCALASGWMAHLPSGLDADRVDLLADRSLPGRWTRLWSERSAWPAVQAPDGRWLSSDGLEERTRLVATRLLAAGAEPGDRVALSAATSAEFVIAYVAALRAGLVVLPLNPAYTETEVRRVIEDARPVVAIVDDRRRASWITEALPEDSIQVLGIDLALPAASDPAVPCRCPISL